MAVAKEDVIAAYRMILGRQPESDAVVSRHAQCASLDDLRRRFLQSPEFKAQSQRWQAGPNFRPLDLPPLVVETEADDEQLARAVGKIKDAWSHLGITRPHFSVLTNKAYLPASLGDNIDAFWRSGEAEAAVIESVLARHGFTELENKTCVEYGCGVGRVSMPLARRFGAVHGYDISPNHLEHARDRARVLGVRNFLAHECGETFIDRVQPCDFYYSRIVFQHNPPIIIAHLFRQALRSLKPGGMAVIQVPTYIRNYRFVTSEWLQAEHSLDMQMHCLPQARIFELIEQENCIPIEVREDNSTGAPEKYFSNTFVIQRRRREPLGAMSGIAAGVRTALARVYGNKKRHDYDDSNSNVGR